MATTCGHCGAAIKTLTARFCEFCGTERPRAAPPPPPSPHGDLPARFAALNAHALLGELRRHRPSTVGHQAGNVFGVLFALVFLAVSFFIFVGFQSAAPGPFALFPLIFLGAGVYLLVKMLSRTSRLASSPLEHVPALVVDERIEVSGGGGDSRSHTTYYVSLETADGERAEYESRGPLNGKVAPGDLGLAYIKGGFLLDFRRVPV